MGFIRCYSADAIGEMERVRPPEDGADIRSDGYNSELNIQLYTHHHIK